MSYYSKNNCQAKGFNFTSFKTWISIKASLREKILTKICGQFYNDC
jgi:hypothetical protein